MTTRALLSAFALTLSANLLHAQQTNVQCGSGSGTYAPFSIAKGGSGSMQVGDGPGNSVPIERLRNYCAPPAPDFVADDSKMLLAKIKLVKLQSDSSKALLKSFTARQKTITDQRRNTDATERKRTVDPVEKMSSQQVRQMYLTPEMIALRNEYSATLRALMTVEQTIQFDLNIAALKAKDAKS